MHANRIPLAAALLMTVPAVIGCDRPAGSEVAGDPVSVKQSAVVIAGLGELVWTLPAYADPLSVPLVALNELKINDRARVFNIGRSPGEVVSLGSAQTNLGVDTIVGETNSVASVFLRERATVSGNLTTAGTLMQQSGTSVLGTIRQGATMERGSMGLSLQFPPSAVDVQSSELNMPLAPGRYRRITVRGGGITLTAGVYKVDEFIVDARQGVIIDSSGGPVILLVTSTFNFQGFAAYSKGTDDFPGWVVGYAGSADLYIGSQLTDGQRGHGRRRPAVRAAARRQRLGQRLLRHASRHQQLDAGDHELHRHAEHAGSDDELQPLGGDLQRVNRHRHPHAVLVEHRHPARADQTASGFCADRAVQNGALATVVSATGTF